MNSKTNVTFTLAAIAAVVLLFASGPIAATQQALAGFGFGGFHRGFGFHHFGFFHHPFFFHRHFFFHHPFHRFY